MNKVLKINVMKLIKKTSFQNSLVLRRGVYDTVRVVVEKNKLEEKGKSGQHRYYMIHCKKESLVSTK